MWSLYSERYICEKYCIIQDKRDKYKNTSNFVLLAIKEENDKQKAKLNDEFMKQYKIMQLLPSGIIQNKLILELQECARKLFIHYPDDHQDNPIMLKKTINELKAQLELERKHRKEENTDEYNT